MAGAFDAFPPETLRFLEGVSADNSRTWFEANRGLYEAGYVAPACAFVEAMGPRLAALSPGVRWEARVNGSVPRINRDVRFSKDKRPYKDHLDIWFWHGDRKGWDRPGFYLRITPERLYMGSGMHVLQGPMLERFRQAVLDPAAGEKLETALAEVAAAGCEPGASTRRNVPRGFDKEHPRANLLLHEALCAGRELPAADAVTPGFTDRAFACYAASWPVGRWLLDHVAG